jgi:hypothetical protein
MSRYVSLTLLHFHGSKTIAISSKAIKKDPSPDEHVCCTSKSTAKETEGQVRHCLLTLVLN